MCLLASFSTGETNRIQVSNTTANLLTVAGKGHWLHRRENSIVAKGKGVLNTFWLDISNDEHSQQKSLIEVASSSSMLVSTKRDRLVDWVVEILASRLRVVLARRKTVAKNKKAKVVSEVVDDVSDIPLEDRNPLDEVVEVIVLPDFDKNAVLEIDPRSVNIPANILEELRLFVAGIANMYHENAFHNFEHACHGQSSPSVVAFCLAYS